MIDPLVNRIVEDARVKAQRIIDEAEREAKAMIEARRREAIEAARREASSIIMKAEVEAAYLKRRILVDARMRAKWMEIVEKNKLIEDVLREAARRLENMPRDDRYRRFLEDRIYEYGVLAGGGDLEVVLSEDDRGLKLDIDRIAERVEATVGIPTTIRVSDSRLKSRWGVVVRRLDGSVEIDGGLEAVFERLKPKLQPMLARILFMGV
ncbi:MAG: V-type ATP synthase subunit E family protein [Candidatus Bathyarchaeia archaeon]